MRLTTGRTVAHYLSGNQTRRIGALVAADTRVRGWRCTRARATVDGEPVKVDTRRGRRPPAGAGE